MAAELTEEKAIEERLKYVQAWNHTMIKIWKERITLLDVIDTGRLLNSPFVLKTKMDGRVLECQLSESFREYGLWQDYGTGKEVWRGNPGDIGRPKVRKRRPWFSKKYYASVMNIKEFMQESLGRHFQGILMDMAAKANRRSNGR